MFKTFAPSLAAAILCCAGCQKKTPEVPRSAPATTDETAAKTGGTVGTTEPSDEGASEPASSSVEITPLQHGSLLLSWNEFVIAVDPVTGALEAAEGDEPKADLIFVTHIHGDHLDPEAIASLRKSGAPVVVPQSVADKAGDALPDPTIVANGDEATFLDGTVGVDVVPMYNLKRKRDSGEFFHPRGRGNAYLLQLGDERVYISGDTECTPEMKQLESIDIAFVCMNLPYTMPPAEAAECIREFKPKRLYPYHYRGQDPSEVEELLKDVPEIDVEILDWYPGGE